MNSFDPGNRAQVQAWVVATLVGFGMLGISFGTWLSRLPAVRDHMGATTLEMSVYGLALSLGSLTGLGFSGRTVSHFGARRTLFAGIGVQAIAMPAAIALLWIDQVGPGLALLVVYGFAFGTSDVAINVSGAEAERLLGRPRMPLFHGAYSLGAVAALGIGSAAEALSVAPPVHVTVMLALVGAVGLLSLRWAPGRLPGAHGERSDGAGSVITGPVPILAASAAPQRYSPWRDPRIYLVGLIALSMSLAEGTGADWISLALVDGRGFDNSTATLTVAVFFAAMVLTRFAGAPILERLGRVAVIRSGALICMLGIVVMILIPVPWIAVVGAALWGAGCALGFPVGISAAADDPRTAVKSVAAVSMLAYGAYLIGPPMIGFLGEHFGLLPAFWPIVAIVLLCVVVAGAARRPAER